MNPHTTAAADTGPDRTAVFPGPRAANDTNALPPLRLARRGGMADRARLGAGGGGEGGEGGGDTGEEVDHPLPVW